MRFEDVPCREVDGVRVRLVQDGDRIPYHHVTQTAQLMGWLFPDATAEEVRFIVGVAFGQTLRASNVERWAADLARLRTRREGTPCG
jgi:hypothetical protein